MIDHGRVRSTVSPENVVVDESSVWVAEDIQTVEEILDGETRTEYEYSLTQYSKDEYIRVLIETNATLEAQVTDTQLALCEVYELLL